MRSSAKPSQEPTIETDEILSEVPSTYQAPAKKLLDEFAGTFNPQLGDYTRTAEHNIKLTTTKPVRVQPYPYNNQKREIIRTQIQEMLLNGVIEPSNSPYNSPIVLVTKKNGQPRFCVDYRQLNAITEDEPLPFPIIHRCLKELGTAEIFSTLDLKNGYWQVPVGKDSKQYTSFMAPDGASYRFRVMPFGLKNAPSTFQRLMNQVLSGLINKVCIVYLDDIVIFSATWEDHLQGLRLVLERLQMHQLKCNLEKCQIGRKEITYLGHVVTAEGNKPFPETIHAIQAAAPPRNRKELRAFLGLCEWVSEFVPRFAELARALTDLLSTKSTFKWTTEAAQSFESVKEA